MTRNQELMSGVLSRDDLFLLMESYRNTIELNTTLLEQQKLIVDTNKHIIDLNVKICEEIAGVIKKLDVCAVELNKTHQQWNESRIKYNAQNSEEHIKLKGYLNILAVATGTLCISAVGALVKVAFMFSDWSDSIHLLEPIAKAVGVG